jgi:bifunctional UDP-N-acetylglucosamine pyrophosphorylase / glucosamine-1-phosphate N-acetyltransferase
MAAGRGTRMRSKTAKVLHPLCGRPLLLWPVEAAREANAERLVVVLDPAVEDVRRVLPPGVEIATQREQKGTGDAVISARDKIDDSGSVIVLSGDHPLVDSAFLGGLAERHATSGAAATIATHEVESPGEYGRIVRDADGQVERIVEAKTPGDATAAELAIKEINIGTYAFRTKPLLEALQQLRPENAQGELYLGDVVPVLRAAGEMVVAHRTDDAGAGLGINTRADLATVRAICQRKIIERHMLAGVTITDPASTMIDVDVRIGEDTVVDPYTFLHGQVAIGDDCQIGPMTTLIDCALGNGVQVLHSYLTACEVLDGCKIGPFSYIRPGTRLGEEVKQGAFTEIKNSNIGEGAKIPHLSYVGDADVGEGANVAAGNIVANWDGRRKHRTVIGADVKTGVHTTFIAPLTVGDRAYTGAGSVITEDIPEGALGIARAPQQNVEGYADRVDDKPQADNGDDPGGEAEAAEAAKKPVSEGGKQS